MLITENILNVSCVECVQNSSQVLETILSLGQHAFVEQPTFLQMIYCQIRRSGIQSIAFWSLVIVVLITLVVPFRCKVCINFGLSRLRYLCAIFLLVLIGYSCLDMESARIAQPKVPSPTLSAASKGEKNILSINEDTMKTKEIEEGKAISSGPQTLEKVKATKAVESEATHESMSVKEQASQGSALLVDEEVQQKMAASEAGNF